ncbi:HTH-type transcriptional activator IlvY [Leucothrix pacifica]|uniref:HTH-type transcriptional activator IlvY n=1 Tax=Leucothrix pacifica TaxID=1247513 RepID=A0A317CCL7_9GAMM|nr:HTH-type transcriptional activator IlvY [Leucothrix pacifica]PWQ96127.1 HTH-type transcriptional activator IlvY [Leucothrix pacifica]
MNIRTLQHFLALAENLHFGRASDISNISISALSRNIRQLEDSLEVTLFNRDNRTVKLTEEGEKFLKYAREALSQWQIIQNELGESSDELRGEISLYCSVTASYSILFELLNRFRTDFPGIEIKLHTGDPEHAIARVLAGNEEISIAAHPRTLPKGVVFKPITVSPLVFIAPREQLNPEVPIMTPDSTIVWSSVPMVLSETGIARNRVDAWFRDMQIKPRIYAQVEGYEAIVSMVSLGLGIGVVPKIVLDNSPLAERIQILDVSPALDAFNIGSFTLKRNLKNPLVDAFWKVIQ